MAAPVGGGDLLESVPDYSWGIIDDDDAAKTPAIKTTISNFSIIIRVSSVVKGINLY